MSAGSSMKDSPEQRAEELMAAAEVGGRRRRRRRRQPLTWSTHTEITWMLFVCLFVWRHTITHSSGLHQQCCKGDATRRLQCSKQERKKNNFDPVCLSWIKKNGVDLFTCARLRTAVTFSSLHASAVLLGPEASSELFFLFFVFFNEWIRGSVSVCTCVIAGWDSRTPAPCMSLPKKHRAGPKIVYWREDAPLRHWRMKMRQRCATASWPRPKLISRQLVAFLFYNIYIYILNKMNREWDVLWETAHTHWAPR